MRQRTEPGQIRTLPKRLQPTRSGAFLPSKLLYHRVAARAAEPWALGSTLPTSVLENSLSHTMVNAQECTTGTILPAMALGGARKHPSTTDLPTRAAMRKHKSGRDRDEARRSAPHSPSFSAREQWRVRSKTVPSKSCAILRS